MGDLVNIKATALRHLGTKENLGGDNFYINGRFLYEYETKDVQVSIENTKEFYVFAVSDSMDMFDEEKQINISITRELKKFQNKVETGEWELSQKAKMLEDIVDEISRLLSSISSDKYENKPKDYSFISLLVQGREACILTLGTGKAYILRNGVVKQLTTDWEKTERLLRLGVITEEQAKQLQNRFGIPSEDNLDKIQKTEKFTIKEGDVFLLCTKGLTDIVETENIYDVLLSDRNTEDVTNKLIKEAFKNKTNSKVATIAVGIEKILNSPSSASRLKKTQKKHYRKVSSRQKINIPYIGNISANTLKKYVIIGLLGIIILTLSFGTAKLISNIAKKSKNLRDQEILSSGLDNNESNQKGTENEENQENMNNNEQGTEGESQDVDLIEEELLPTEYKVKRGDTLYNISNMFYDTPENYKIIMEENNIYDPCVPILEMN